MTTLESTTDLHVGYEGAIGDGTASWYIQGPAVVAPDGAETETRFSGKVGIAADSFKRRCLW